MENEVNEGLTKFLYVLVCRYVSPEQLNRIVTEEMPAVEIRRGDPHIEAWAEELAAHIVQVPNTKDAGGVYRELGKVKASQQTFTLEQAATVLGADFEELRAEFGRGATIARRRDSGGVWHSIECRGLTSKRRFAITEAAYQGQDDPQEA